MDVLADVLSVTNMANTVLCQAELLAPWGMAVDPSTEVVVHVVQRGACWLTIAGGQPVRLEQGDVAVVTGEAGHVVSDAPDRPGRPYADVLAEMAGRPPVAAGRIEPLRTLMLCAKYSFSVPGRHPLVSHMPSLIHVSARDVAGSPQLQLLLQLMHIEAEIRGSGTDLVVPRLVDSLLIFVLRAWLSNEPSLSASWFNALRDPAVSKALAVIHQAPHQSWTVQSLAAAAGQTRATFARRFASLVGETPLAYVTRWRMCLAAKLLSDGRAAIEQVAVKVGYEGAPAFSKAFRRHFGVAPGQFRAAA